MSCNELNWAHYITMALNQCHLRIVIVANRSMQCVEHHIHFQTTTSMLAFHQTSHETNICHFNEENSLLHVRSSLLTFAEKQCWLGFSALFITLFGPKKECILKTTKSQNGLPSWFYSSSLYKKKARKLKITPNTFPFSLWYFLNRTNERETKETTRTNIMLLQMVIMTIRSSIVHSSSTCVRARTHEISSMEPKIYRRTWILYS